jgi:uncharacterized membrane protein
MDDSTMKRAVKMLLIGLIIYILWCKINAETESTIFYKLLNEHSLVMPVYIVFYIFVMLQFAVILLLVRRLKVNKKMNKILNEKKFCRKS